MIGTKPDFKNCIIVAYKDFKRCIENEEVFQSLKDSGIETRSLDLIADAYAKPDFCYVMLDGHYEGMYPLV